MEHRYAAVLLASLVTGDALGELGDPVLVPERIRLQASAFSPVDDIQIIGRPQSGGGHVEVFVGVRRDPSFVPSDEPTVALVGSYLREIDEHWVEIQTGAYRLVLALIEPSRHGQQLARLTQLAITPGHQEFRIVAAASGPTSSELRARLDKLDEVVAKAAATCGIDTSDVSATELTWRLLSSLTVKRLRLEDEDERDRTQAVNQLRSHATQPSLQAAEAVMSRIEHLVDTWVPAGADLSEAMLRRALRPRLKERFAGFAGRDQPDEVEPDALARGPIAHLGLSRELEEAKHLDATEPGMAAVRYAKIAKELDDSIWAPFATGMRQLQADAHHRAGDHAQGIIATITILVAALQTGEAGRGVAASTQLAQNQYTVPEDLIRSANALGSLAAFEYDHRVTLDDVADTIEALHPSDSHAAMAAAMFAEHALASKRPELLTPRAEALSRLAAAAPDSDLLWRARLRACQADADPAEDAWTALTRSARADYPPQIRALLLARHARYQAENGDGEQALDRFTEAVERAADSGYHQDAAVWAEAGTLVRLRYDLDTDKLADNPPTVSALRTAGHSSVLPTPRSPREWALRSLTGQPHPADALQALTQYLRHAVAAGSWLEESEAHELLGCFHRDHHQTAAALPHLIAAGADHSLSSLAQSLPDITLTLPRPQQWADQPRWRRHSLFTAIKAIGDLIPDDQAADWAAAALDEISNKRPVPFGTASPRLAAFGALASVIDAATRDQAQRFLDLSQTLLRHAEPIGRTAGQDHVLALIRIARNYDGPLRPAAVDQLCQALLSDAFMANAVLSWAGETLRLQPETVAHRCGPHATTGNVEAALALVLAEAPADAARPMARQLIDRLHGSNAGQPQVAATPAQASALIGSLLEHADHELWAQALLGRVSCHQLPADQRQEALDALYVLAPYLSVDQRARILEVATQAAQGDLDGSQHDDLGLSHPYDRFQINLGPTTLRYHGVSTAAHLADTPAARRRIVGLALPLLSQSEGSGEPLIAQALLQVMTGQAASMIPALAGHSSPGVREVAAYLWCAEDQQETVSHLGAQFAADPYGRVRYTLASHLPSGRQYDRLRDILRRDPRRSVRTAASR